MALKERFIIVRQVHFEGAGWRTVTEFHTYESVVKRLGQEKRMNGSDDVLQVVASLYDEREVKP